MEMVIFYREWLPLLKEEFNVVVMVAVQGGIFRGYFSDICRCLNISPQTRNRERIQAAIHTLVEKNFITDEIEGRNHNLKVIPKRNGIQLPLQWVQSVLHHDYSGSGKGVAPVQVLKVFAWIVDNKNEIVTNDMIAEELNISASTVISAKNVLEKEYENITKKKRSMKLSENNFQTVGQELQASAWWTDIKKGLIFP